MSVSVTVHDVDLPMVSNPLADLESVRKIANEKLRIRRLVQVRQQSKQLAAKVRQNYQQAKEKELAKIEQTKREEVKAWKRQHVRNLQEEYARNVCEVGEAHRAAEAAEGCAVWFEEKRATQQAVALQRGKTAEANAARERERKVAEKEAKLRKKQYVPSKSIAVQTVNPVVVLPAPAAVDARKEPAVIPADGDSSTEPTPSPYEHFRSSRQRKGLHPTFPETNLSESEDEHYCPGIAPVRIDKENVPMVVHEYSATAFTSPSDYRPNVVSPPAPPKPQRLQPFTQITELIQQRRRQRQHSLHDETRQPSGAYRDTYGTQKTVQFDNLSDNTLSFPTSSVLTHDDRPFPIATNDSPRKVPPRRMVENPKTLPLSQRIDQQQEEVVGKRRKKAVPPESSSSTASYGGVCSTKVQYYDCNTKYRKEYDQPVGFVQREDHRSNDPTGMEEANRYEFLQQELAKARSKPPVDRTKPALEKQQTRKDYEKLSQELDNLTRVENKLKSLAIPTKTVPSEATVKQQAATRQRKAVEAVESLLRQRALVTCPIVQKPTSSEQRPPTVRPSVVNVAQMKTGSGTIQPEGKDISTDSCASIVLDTFERPGIPLPSEATGGMDKIAKLKELLEQINEQRRLLTEELTREKAEQLAKASDRKMDDASVKLEIERLERMKRRQEELLEQQQLLQKREQEVEELGHQLAEKMAMLQRKQQKHREGDVAGKKVKKDAKKTPTIHVETKGQKGTVDVDVVQPSSAGSSISETSKTSYETVDKQTGDVPPPVKIIITVNDKGLSPSKKKHKKKSVQKKTSPVKVVMPEQVSAIPEKQVTLEPAQQPIQPIIKPLATRKDVQVRKKVMELSPGSSSTTSTVYRPLPPKIGSLKILQREVPGAANEPNKQILPDTSKASAATKYHLQKSDDRKKLGITPGANLNPNLLKYIVRLLGMSRQSIDQLGVSSTSVSTPNESIVNVSSNVAGGQPAGVVQVGSLAPNEAEIERANRLRKFIDENYNFLQEIDETLRRSDQSTLGSSDRSGISAANDGSLLNEPSDDVEVSRVEGIWMETLRRRERTMQKQQKKAAVGTDEQSSKGKSNKKQLDKNQRMEPTSSEAVHSKATEPSSRPQPTAPPAPTVKEGSLKSILKSPKRDAPSKVAKIITPQGHVEVINLSDREEQEILERYSQLTERCSQRITELSQMINQVREEKRRLIEDSLSSLEQQESTKYMDLPPTISSTAAQQPSQSLQHPCDVVLSPPGPTAPSVAPIGEDPVSEEIDNIFSSKQIGLSKDSGIAMSRPLTASDIRESPSEEGSQGKEPLPFEPFLKDIPKPALTSSIGGQVEIGGGPKLLSVGSGVLRRNTPPVAIARFSPQLPDELPMHELSTIPEVETPAPVATSKVNDLSTVSVSAGDNANTAEVLAEARNRLLLNEPSIPDIGYDRFMNYEEYVRSTATGTTTGTASFVRMELEQTVDPVERSALALDVTEEREPERLAYRKFPGPAPAFDITEEGEATVQQSVASGSTVNKSGSDASLPDVVAELKKLNIIVKPFDNSLDNSNRSTPLSEAQDTPAPAIGQQQRQEIARPGGSSRQEIPASDLQPLSESFKRDLDNFGLWWASPMLKRTQLEQHSSGSSPNSLTGGAKIVGPNDETVENDAEGMGKPPNLVEFITRELMVRTQSDLQSLSSVSSSSHGSHSALLRSLLNISRLDNSNSNSSPTRELLMHTPTDGKNIQRTSTPVASKSTASGNSLKLTGDGNTDTAVTNRTETGLFSGESRLSSVHWSSSSGNSSDRQEPPPQQRLTVPDLRLERQSSTEKSHR
ncbi:uncharacterized protein LOC128709887 [Anopheles marshallii]|uniref:uncharacterized protein LOC128709887 n=1 Tax=Anopheles marshallii TaxID=1521116 RepID=UPI00237A5013|nr:uncharacterized protein LOC128709887 [Anopheles marshallii]